MSLALSATNVPSTRSALSRTICLAVQNASASVAVWMTRVVERHVRRAIFIGGKSIRPIVEYTSRRRSSTTSDATTSTFFVHRRWTITATQPTTRRFTGNTSDFSEILNSERNIKYEKYNLNKSVNQIFVP